jgi:hypothetical protein
MSMGMRLCLLMVGPGPMVLGARILTSSSTNEITNEIRSTPGIW